MAVSESLIIEVDVKDKLTPELEALTSEVKAFGVEAKKQITTTNQALDKLPESFKTTGKEAEKTERTVSRFSDNAQKKFAALGKAAIGIFSADLIAKTIGYGNALQLVQEIAAGLAESFREFLGFDEEWERQNRQVERFAELVKEARAELEGMALRPRFDFSRTLGVVFAPDLSKFLDDPNKLKQAALAAEEVRKTLERLQNQMRAELSRGGQFSQPNQQTVAAINAQVEQTIAAFNELYSTGALTAAERFESIMAQRMAERARRMEQEQQAIDAQNREEERGIEARIERLQREAAFAERAANANAILAQRRREATLAAGVMPFVQFGRQFAQDAGNMWLPGSPIPDALRLDATALPSAAQLPKGYGMLSGFLANQKPSRIEDVPPEQQVMRFGDAVQNEIRAIGDSIEQNLGNQAVQGVFSSFTGFFMDLFTNVRNADEALKNLGRSLLAVLANQAAQRLALGATNSLFGLFGLSQANGGVWRGGINSFASGGVAYGPQLAMIGDNRSKTEAIVPMPDGRSIPVEMRGGGGTVHMTLNVASLDPRAAADVVLAHMPAIQRGIAAALTGGGDRGLTLAIRGAVA